MSSVSENLDLLILDERGIVNAVAQKELALGGLACFATASRSEVLALTDSHRPYVILYVPKSGADLSLAIDELAVRVRNCAARLLLVCDQPDAFQDRLAEAGIGTVIAVPRHWRDLVPQLNQIRNDTHRLRSLEERAGFQRKLLLASGLGALVISKKSQYIRWLLTEGTGLQPQVHSTGAFVLNNQHWRSVLALIDTRDRLRVAEFINSCLTEPRATSLTALTTSLATLILTCVSDTGNDDNLVFLIRVGATSKNLGVTVPAANIKTAGSTVDGAATFVCEALQAAMRQSDTGVVLLVQLQGIGAVYRHQGYLVGSRLLAEFGEQLGRCLRAEDRVFPLYSTDGDSRVVAQVSDADFVVVLDQPEDNTPLPILRRIRSRLGGSIEVDGNEIDIRYAFGFARWPADGTTPDSLLHAANIAAAPDAAYGSVAPNLARVPQDTEVALHNALRNNAIRMTLQPKVSAGSGRIVGFEALARWEHEGQPIPPDVFIPIAERAGLISAIGESIADQAIAAHQGWRNAGLGCVPIAINVSPYQFDRGDFADQFLGLCQRKAILPGCLSIEITESSLLRNEESTLAQLERLRAAGVTIALDDFGTGYSSLSYLRKLPLDVLKIDKSFIDDLTDNAIDPGLVVSIIAIGTNLGLRVVAEGIETSAQQAMLRDWGCHELQGYRFAPPLGLAQATKALSGSRILPAKTDKTLPSLQDRRHRVR